MSAAIEEKQRMELGFGRFVTCLEGLSFIARNGLHQEPQPSNLRNLKPSFLPTLIPVSFIRSKQRSKLPPICAKCVGRDGGEPCGTPVVNARVLFSEEFHGMRYPYTG